MSVSEFSVEELKSEVSKVLVSTYDMSMEEATEIVEEAYLDDPENWHENADSKRLAAVLAEDDDDE